MKATPPAAELPAQCLQSRSHYRTRNSTYQAQQEPKPRLQVISLLCLDSSTPLSPKHLCFSFYTDPIALPSVNVLCICLYIFPMHKDYSSPLYDSFHHDRAAWSSGHRRSQPSVEKIEGQNPWVWMLLVFDASWQVISKSQASLAPAPLFVKWGQWYMLWPTPKGVMVIKWHNV